MNDKRRQHQGDPHRGAQVTSPSKVNYQLSLFDRFANRASDFTSRAWFFAMCVLVVILWAPTYFFFSLDTWQLIINSITTIITFLLVALLQNTQKRSDDAVQHKLNAVADGIADMLDELGREQPAMKQHSRELRDAIGLEDRESSD